MNPIDFSRCYQLNHSTLLTPLDDHTSELNSFFEFLARQIKKEFNPGTILDIGCNDGSLVVKLQSQGIQAWGIDFSADALINIHPEAERFCDVISPGDSLSRDYDLVVCLETLFHLNLNDAEKVIRSICMQTHVVLFSCAPFHLEDANPAIARSPDYWAGLFSENGFYHDLSYPSLSILPWSMLFFRNGMSITHLVIEYERLIWRSLQEIRLRRVVMMDLQHELSATEQWWRERFRLSERQLEAVESRANQLQDTVNSIYNTYSWKLMMVIQKIRLRLVPLGTWRERWMHQTFHFILTFWRKLISRQ